MPRLKDLIRHRLAPVWEKTIASLGRDLAGRHAGNTVIRVFACRVHFLTLRVELRPLSWVRPLKLDTRVRSLPVHGLSRLQAEI